MLRCCSTGYPLREQMKPPEEKHSKLLACPCRYEHVRPMISQPIKIRPYCVGVDVSDIFFNSTAKRLAIYSQFRYISRIFPTVFSQLISIFIRLLHTYCMGAKTRARLTRLASDMRSYGTRRRIRAITK